jgi:hypothetical protein
MVLYCGKIEINGCERKILHLHFGLGLGGRKEDISPIIQ